ncbi:MAG: hypothetical protein IK955_06140 [Clostridia bacterium]|nr:hypothetical protein [Clostridia bacterium]
MSIISRIISMFLSLLMGILSIFGVSLPNHEVDSSDWNTNYKYVFVHGLMGWGEYDFYYPIMPYWGMFGGNLMNYLNNNGFDCYAASVSGTASAWDRACELYAQLTGTVTDYGKAHSEKCGHDRYGEDFTGRALIDEWDAENKINLLGHSFGGATVRTFAHLMAKGSAEEIAVTSSDEISGLFTGGKADYIYSVTSLAAPHNGTTAYGVETADGAEIDTAAYDMHIDNALALNETLTISNSTYYFSIACSMTKADENGYHQPIKENMESLFTSSSAEIGKLTGTTPGGYVVGTEWLENDGLVNTFSALAPLSDPSTEYDSENVKKGIWNIMPVYYGDHMSLQGGMTVVNNVKPLYVEHLSMINSL